MLLSLPPEDDEDVTEPEPLPWLSTPPAIAGEVALVVCGATALVAGLAGPSPEAWAAIAAWLTVLVAIGAAVVTLHQVEVGRRQRREDDRSARNRTRQDAIRAFNEQSAQQSLARQTQRAQARAAQDLERERTQPYVIVYSEPSPLDPWIIDIVVKNTGERPALNVDVQFDPPLVWTMTNDRSPEFAPVQTNFPVLAPGQEWRAAWDTLFARPPVVASTSMALVTFSQLGGREVVGGPWKFHLDIEMWRRTIIDQTTLKHVVTELKKLANEVARWRDPASGKGLRVYGYDGPKHNDEMREWSAERRQRLRGIEANRQIPPDDPTSAQ